MRPLKQISTWLTLLILAYALTPVFAKDDDVEKWREDMVKDYAKVLKEKTENRKVQRHRQFISKWKQNGHLDDIIHLYQRELQTQHGDAVFHYGFGYAYALQGERRFEKAADQFQQALVLNPKLYYAHFSLGVIYQKQGKDDLALQELATSLRLNPKSYAAHYKRGEIHLKQENLNEALQAFQVAQELNKKWEYPYYGMGLVYFAQGKDHMARESFDEAIGRNKKFAPAYFKLGQVLAKERFFDDALEEYKKGAKHQSYTAETLYELGVIFAEEGESTRALNLYQKAVEIDPQYAPAHLQLGELYYETASRDLAVEHYKKAIVVDPSLKNYFVEQLAPYHAGLMGVQEAKVLMDKSLAVNPVDPQVHFYYAQIEVAADNSDAAIAHYEKTIEFIEANPSYLEMELPFGSFKAVYLELGDLYYQDGNTEQATTTYQRAIELDPSLERHFFNLGKTAFDAEQFKLAIEPFSKFLLIALEDVETNYLLGISHESLERLDDALRFYARTIELDAGHQDAMMQSAKIYRRQNNPGNTLVMLKQLIGVAPENVEAHYLSALSYLELNQSENALTAFLETSRLQPTHVDAHYQAGMLYEQSGEVDNAVERYEKTIALDQSKAAPFLRLGHIYHERGDKDNVIRVYELGLTLEPNHPQAQYDLAAIFEEREESKKAITHFGLANQYDDSRYDWHFRYARLLDRHAETLETYHQYASMAVNEYSKTTELKPEYAPAYLHRGLITYQYKDIGGTLYSYSQISEDFRQTIELLKGRTAQTDLQMNTDAHYYLARTYLDIDQQHNAKEAFQKTLQLDRKYKGANLQIGLIAEWEQKYQEAITHFEKEIAIDSQSTKAYQRLGMLYANSKLDLGQAKIYYQKALQLEPEHVETLLNYGDALFHLDRLGAATEQFERVLQIEPENLTGNFNLALMYQYTDKKNLAIARWKKFLKLNPPAEWKSQAEEHLQKLGG